MPGPACYGRGGTLPTVTDANLVAGRIPTQASFSDLGTLDVKAAAEALAAGGFSAADVLAVVNANMAGALRQVTIERGTDPSEVALVAFGGAGPLHACDLADELGMPAVIVPPRAGVLSAVGILGGPRQTYVVQSWPATADHEGLAEAAAALAAWARADLRHADRVAERYDCRYRGQSHELTVDHPDGFAAEHVRRNGYSRPDTPVEVVALRASAEADSPVKLADLPPGARRDATGPTVVVEPDTTLWVPEGWCATAGGELLVQAEHIPVHLGSMPASVQAAIDAFGGDLAPGEQVILNDPYAGGTHLNDVTLVAPCHVDGRIVGWAANRAHHADVGGSAPGSIPSGARTVFEEGLRIPPVRFTDDVVAIICANSRTPVERRGDLDAQMGANRCGVARLAELAGAPLSEVTDHGERRMRAALAGLPDGTWRFEDVMDSVGPRPSQQAPARIAVQVTLAGDGVIFDFSGTDRQRPGNVNAPAAVTVSCVGFALRSATDPTIPSNGGAMRPVEVVAPSGTLVAAEPPAAGRGVAPVGRA